MIFWTIVRIALVSFCLSRLTGRCVTWLNSIVESCSRYVLYLQFNNFASSVLVCVLLLDPVCLLLYPLLIRDDMLLRWPWLDEILVTIGVLSLKKQFTSILQVVQSNSSQKVMFIFKFYFKLLSLEFFILTKQYGFAPFSYLLYAGTKLWEMLMTHYWPTYDP